MALCVCVAGAEQGRFYRGLARAPATTTTTAATSDFERRRWCAISINLILPQLGARSDWQLGQPQCIYMRESVVQYVRRAQVDLMTRPLSSDDEFRSQAGGARI
jgi:hypothetical protein